MSSQKKAWTRFFPQVFVKSLLAISTMLALVACGAVTVFPSAAPTSATLSESTDASGTRHFFCPGSTSPTVTITNLFGNIRVLAGKAGEVAIHETVVDNGDGYSGYVGTGCALGGKMDISRTIEVVGSPQVIPPDIDFDVVVPPDATLVMQTGRGDISVSGVDGQMTLLSTKGSIQFEGSLTMGRSYRLKTTTGSVEATIAKNSAFHVDAIVKSGQLTAPDFPTLIAQGMGRGAEVHSDVGAATSSHAELSIEVDMGSISLHQAR